MGEWTVGGILPSCMAEATSTADAPARPSAANSWEPETPPMLVPSAIPGELHRAALPRVQQIDAAAH